MWVQDILAKHQPFTTTHPVTRRSVFFCSVDGFDCGFQCRGGDYQAFAAHQADVLSAAGLRFFVQIQHEEGVCEACGCMHVDGPEGLHCPWCDPDEATDELR